MEVTLGIVHDILRIGRAFRYLGMGGGRIYLLISSLGTLDREGNARKVVNCSCVVVRDWGEESQERSILLDYFQTEQ